MALKEGDLKNTILKDISIDEFEPKTGEAADVMVVGLYLNETAPAKDLYHFINNSIVEIRDVEVSPNPNPDNFYMVFMEIDRNETCMESVKALIEEVERLSGKLDWQVSTTLSENKIGLHDDSLMGFIQCDPENYLTKEEFMAQQLEAEQNTEQPLEESLGGLSKMSIEDGTKHLFKHAKIGEQIPLYDLTFNKMPIPKTNYYVVKVESGYNVLVSKTLNMATGQPSEKDLIPVNKDARAVTCDINHDGYKLQAPLQKYQGREASSLYTNDLDIHISTYKEFFKKASSKPELYLQLLADIRALEYQKFIRGASARLESAQNNDAILEFFKPSNILEADINDNVLQIKGSRDIASLQIVNFGHGPDIMEEVGISESAIKQDYDKISFAKLNAMLGEMKALPIDEYIVIYNPEHKDILIAKAS